LEKTRANANNQRTTTTSGELLVNNWCDDLSCQLCSEDCSIHSYGHPKEISCDNRLPKSRDFCL